VQDVLRDCRNVVGENETFIDPHGVLCGYMRIIRRLFGK